MPSFNITFDSEILRLASERGESIDIRLTVKPPAASSAAAPPPTATPPRGPLAALISGGRLEPGQRLIFSQPRARRTAAAKVRADGSLEVEGRSGAFWSPSKAAAAITGSQINGWTLWRLDDGRGRTLDDLRTEMEESEG